MYEAFRDDSGAVVAIKRLSDGAFIGLNQSNPDYRDFLAWNKTANLDLSVKPPPPDPREVAISAARARLKELKAIPRIDRKPKEREEIVDILADLEPTP